MSLGNTFSLKLTVLCSRQIGPLTTGQLAKYSAVQEGREEYNSSQRTYAWYLDVELAMVKGSKGRL